MPVRREAVVVHAAEADLAWSGSAAADVRRAGDGVVWWQQVDLPAGDAEVLAPPPAESLPGLYVSDRRNRWEDETSEYLGQIADRLEPGEAVRRLAAEHTKSCTTEEEKVAALARLVQRDVSYKAIEFGKRARIMHPAERTWSQRYGDCKDMSLLLAQLLQSAGVEAHPALVHTSVPLQTDLPSLDQFNHMIVYLPTFRGGSAIDPTSKTGNPLEAVPYGLADRQIYVLDGPRSRIVRLPKYGTGSNRAVVERRVSYDASGTAAIDERAEFHGHLAGAIRGLFQATDVARRATVWSSYLSTGGNPAKVRSCKVEHLDDVTRPLIVETRYSVDRALLSAEDAFVGTVPSPIECLWLRPEPIERRRRPLHFEFPLEIDATTTITPPAGRSFASVERLNRVADGAILEWRVDASLVDASLVDASLVDGALRLHCTVGRRPGSHPPQAYTAFCDAAEQCVDAISPTLVFRPTGGR